MQQIFAKYRDFTSIDFVIDDDFIEWVLNPDDEKNIFWGAFISQHPQQEKNILDAKRIISSLDFTKEEAGEEIKNKIWESVKSHSGKAIVKPLASRRMWMAAASIILILLAGTYFYFNKKSETTLAKVDNTSAHLKNDILPGGNKAVLTLANGSKIILDSAQNGALTHQGNSKIIKVAEGQLAYEPGKTKSIEIQYNTVSTPRGGQYQLILADGSKVWLNAESSITFPVAFTGNERNVSIKGEAYFEVAHNPTMPFHVEANNIDVQVLGTHFNVNAYNDEDDTKTTLLEGSVKISKGNRNVLISPGQQAVVTNASGNISVDKNADVEQAVAWKNGYFQFDNSTITEIMKQISRWYNVEISYKGDIPAGHYVGKPSRNLNLSKILKVIEYSGVKLKVEGNNIIVGE